MLAPRNCPEKSLEGIFGWVATTMKPLEDFGHDSLLFDLALRLWVLRLQDCLLRNGYFECCLKLVEAEKIWQGPGNCVEHSTQHLGAPKICGVPASHLFESKEAQDGLAVAIYGFVLFKHIVQRLFLVINELPKSLKARALLITFDDFVKGFLVNWKLPFIRLWLGF